MRCANTEERVAKKQLHELWAICVSDVASIKASVKGKFLSRKLQGYNSQVCSLGFFKCISYVVKGESVCVCVLLIKCHKLSVRRGTSNQEQLFCFKKKIEEERNAETSS